METLEITGQLGTAIRSLREAQGFSQESFADHIGMHRAYFSSIERGERNITVGTMARVALGLKTSLSSIFAAAGL